MFVFYEYLDAIDEMANWLLQLNYVILVATVFLLARSSRSRWQIVGFGNLLVSAVSILCVYGIKFWGAKARGDMPISGDGDFFGCAALTAQKCMYQTIGAQPDDFWNLPLATAPVHSVHLVFYTAWLGMLVSSLLLVLLFFATLKKVI